MSRASTATSTPSSPSPSPSPDCPCPGARARAEGHVLRVKMLKRQMFGRAGFNLLRKSVLLA
ncbi:hypothetical protein EJC51_45115 [Streptomyces aquilus]|uniref:Uncharacterized protein n=1 Tax=Streptomyces aquilus TaxID=2548456 RepID=A0A3S9IE64_9ACTN|nr:hypothetical protein EJC51_45115 [Streptomyces aquilus]